MLLNKVTIESSTAVLIFLVYLALPSHGANPGVAVPRVASKLPKMMDIPRRVVNSQMISQYLGGPSSALDKLKRGAQFFDRMRKVIQGRKPVNGGTKKLRQQRLLEDIFTCRPDHYPLKSCYGPCSKKGYSYAWCFTSSEKRNGESAACTCKLKEVVVEFLEVSKERLLSSSMKPMSTTEVGLIIGIGILAFIVVSGLVAIGVWMLRQRRVVEPNLPENVGQIHVNPIYYPPGQLDQEQEQNQ